MAKGHNDLTCARSTRRMLRVRGRADSASHVDERLMEELRQLRDEIIDEPVPQDLLDVIRARKPRNER